MSEESYSNMLNDLSNEVSCRINNSFSDIHEMAVMNGLSIGGIADEIGCSRGPVWDLYKEGNPRREKEIENYIKTESIKRLIKSIMLLNSFKSISGKDIFFEKIIDIKKMKYEGKVFGLSVPRNHNYIGGFGACGINHNTYPLPEAQVDRFLFKLFIDYPKIEEERKVLEINISLRDFSEYGLKPVISTLDLIKMQEIARKIYVSDAVREYIVRLIDATRHPEKYNLKSAKYIRYGSSPRASIGLYIASKANALMKGKDYVTPQDIKEIAHDVLRHRLLLNYEGQAENINRDDIIDEILAKVPIP
ncbi:MAG: hypothetical protein KKG75_04960 [Nanoarchaeota archaeon]|nr:hypothetical protein [Nanoarchaeota archaeon]